MAINWNKLLADPRVLAVLEKVASDRMESFQPTVGLDGTIVYQALHDIPSNEAVPLLDMLSKEGVLERRSEARLVGCPIHENTFELLPRLKCPNDGSVLLKKGTLLQHNCGYMGNLEVFKQTCPRCGKPSPPQTVKMMGTWYECETDKTRFAAPNVYLYCRKFDHDFPLQQAVLVDEASYRLTPEAEDGMKGRAGTILMIKQGLQSAGIAVDVSGSMLGASGVQHTFDLIIHERNSSIPVDVKLAKEGEVGVAAVLATYAKALDTKTMPAVLVAVPSASEDAKKSVAAYGMLMIEGSEAKSIVLDLIKNLLVKTAQEPGATVEEPSPRT